MSRVFTFLRRHYVGLIAISLTLLGGSAAYAAGKIGSNDISKNAIKSKHIASGQVQATDLAPGVGVPNIITVKGPVETLAPAGSGSGSVGASLASCPSGTEVVGGGWDGGSSPPVRATVGYNYAISEGAWSIIMVNDANISATFQTVARCQAAGGRAALASPSQDDLREQRQQVEALRVQMR